LENNGDDVMIFGMQLGDICLHWFLVFFHYEKLCPSKPHCPTIRIFKKLIYSYSTTIP
jgi:hypothetical protein